MNTEDFMATVKPVSDYLKEQRKGFITCSDCGSRVTTSSKAYGGMLRLVCLNDLCSNSELKAFN
jgi:hypothetical protein